MSGKKKNQKNQESVYHGDPQKEADVLRDVRYVLGIFQARGDLVYFRVNVSPVLRGKGTFSPNPMAGFSDLIVLLANGTDIFAELKAGKGKQSPKQIDFQRLIEKSRGGRIYAVWHSVEECVGCLRVYGLAL